MQILQKIPATITNSELEKDLVIDRSQAFSTFLYKEAQRYNSLLEVIRRNLDDTLSALEGNRFYDAVTEESFECLISD